MKGNNQVNVTVSGTVYNEKIERMEDFQKGWWFEVGDYFKTDEEIKLCIKLVKRYASIRDVRVNLYALTEQKDLWQGTILNIENEEGETVYNVHYELNGIYSEYQENDIAKAIKNSIIEYMKKC